MPRIKLGPPRLIPVPERNESDEGEKPAGTLPGDAIIDFDKVYDRKTSNKSNT